MVAVVILGFCIALGARSDISPVVIDGELNDPLWQHLSVAKLAPSEDAVPGSMGGEIRAVTAGAYLYLSAHLPEPGGHVMANSVGFDPVWEGSDEARQIAFFHLYNGAPEGEDYVRFVIRNYNENDWMLQVGPLGAYSVKWHWTGEREWYTSDPKKCDRFLVAAKINADSWNVEAAVPLDQLGSPGPGGLQLSVERNRAERPKEPQEGWRWPEHQPTAQISSLLEEPGQEVLSNPVYRPTAPGGNEPPIPVGYRKTLPAMESPWTDAAWRDVPPVTLRRNEAAARLPRFPTEARLVQDGHTLAVIARCVEPDEIVAHAKERDAEVENDDSFQVYLATSGSRYVQYAINPLGVLLDAFGNNGTIRLSLPHREWNSPVRGAAWRDQETWYARLDLPLEAAAEVLGETQPPNQWKILLMRNRPGRRGEPRENSVLPVTQSNTAFCPARYRRMELVKNDPAELPKPPLNGRSGKLALLPSQVFSPEQRAQMDFSGMMSEYYRSHILEYLKSDKQAWDQVKTVDDWRHFRDPRLEALRASLGKFPARCRLDTHVSGEFRGNGYRRENLAYQSQPGIWVTANLYLPEQPHDPMPGILILPALHNAKPQWELQDMGIMWAKSGCAVLIIDQVGYGERLETHPWDKEYINARYIEGEQLYLTGSSLLTWMVWDAMRGIDLLLDQPNVDKKEIVLLGAVAGGGDPAAVTAALDSRVAAVVPFNFGEAMPETSRFIPYKNEWPLDLAEPTIDDWDTTRVIRRNVVDGFLQWVICASVAPRRFVYSYELGWNVEDLPAWARYQKVFNLYNASGNLSEAHGFGAFPGPGEAENVGPAQRRSLGPTLERWFGIPVSFTDVQSSVLANLAERPSTDRRPVSELAVLTPSVAQELHIKTLHEVAYAQGLAEVQSVHAELARLSPADRRQWLAKQWAEKLGNIEPNPHPQVTVEWTKEIPDARAEAIALNVEPGILVPMLLLHPLSSKQGPPPVAVAVAEGGKDLFLAKRSEQIEALLKGGVAVCLIDVRGTGETGPSAAANTALVLGETLLGERLRDLRTALVYLASRTDLDSQRVGLWGDSFSPPNPERMLLDETPLWRIGPQIEQEAEPLGGLLALLGSLYENHVQTVAVQGGLASYLSILEDSFAYVPQDVIVPGVLEAGDIADIASALAPHPLLLQGLVDGRDRLVPADNLKRALAPVYEAYRGAASSVLSIRPGESASQLAHWFLAHLSSASSRRDLVRVTP
jgi:hypothetical protein